MKTGRTIGMWLLYFQDEDNIIGTSFMPYVQNVAGLIGVNYRAEPYLHREEEGCSLGRMFQPCEVDNPRILRRR